MKTQWKKQILLLFIVIVAILVGACKEEKSDPVTYRGPSPKQEEKEETEEKVTEYILQEVNMVEETVTAFSTDSGRPVRYRYNLGTKFLDKYGDRCSAVHFTPGQVVKLGESKGKSVIESVQMSDSVWNYEDIKNYNIDQERGVFTIGKSNYRINNQVKVFSNDQEIGLDQIGQEDILHVIGRDKDIISVMVTTGHGYIQLANTTLFENSMICIGNKIFTTIVGDMMIEVPEGSYDITVANKGYGGTGQYDVVRNQVTLVDLDTLKGEGPKICKLKFESQIAGVQVYIDGNVMPVGQEVDVTYGAHQLAVVAEGYDRWQKTLVVNSPSATITLDLDQSDMENKTDENTNNTNNANNNNTSTTTTNSSSNTNKNTSNKTSSNGNSTSNSSKNNNNLSDSQVDYLTTISKILETVLK